MISRFRTIFQLCAIFHYIELVPLPLCLSSPAQSLRSNSVVIFPGGVPRALNASRKLGDHTHELTIAHQMVRYDRRHLAQAMARFRGAGFQGEFVLLANARDELRLPTA